MEWTVPKMWPGATCYILGGGPSMAYLEEKDFEIIKKKRTIVTNNAYQLAPWSEALFFMDHDWFKKHEVSLASYHGLKVTIANQMKEGKGIKWLKRGSKAMISLDPCIVNNGNNSGHCAVNLAYHFGVSKIILVGFDMRIVESKHNYHNKHHRKMKDSIYQDEYIPNLESMKEPLEKQGVQILNATPESALKCFKTVDLKETVNY